MMKKDNYYILTGAPGTGKSTLINSLRENGHFCIDEPAREIIAEQKAIDGMGIYEKNPQLFIELILSRSICRYNQNKEHNYPVIFDRAIPDIIAYSKLCAYENNSFKKSAMIYQYNTKVFYLPIWDKIYSNDEDRKMTLKDAKDFDKLIRQSYRDLNYELIEVPLESVAARVEFIEKHI